MEGRIEGAEVLEWMKGGTMVLCTLAAHLLLLYEDGAITWQTRYGRTFLTLYGRPAMVVF